LNQRVLDAINEYKQKFPSTSNSTLTSTPENTKSKDFNGWEKVPANFSGKVKVKFTSPSYLKCTLKD
jgi:hypothetical protein